ncbi:MAG: Asp23/Gls24 family envelope stress response protein [Caldisericota bacterium]|nr:Asp23/Gls24 family envelope stress response protein [Caldisericota bacterium]
MSKIIITDEAIEAIILNATLSVDGVLDSWKGMEEYIPYLNKDKKHSHGIDFVLEKDVIKVNIFITVAYGVDLRKVGKEVMDKVKAQIENMTPYKLSTIVVFIEDIKYEEQE